MSALYCTAPVLHCTVPVPALSAHGVTVGALEDPPRGPHLLQADRTLQQLTHTEMSTMFKIKSFMQLLQNQKDVFLSLDSNWPNLSNEVLTV